MQVEIVHQLPGRVRFRMRQNRTLTALQNAEFKSALSVLGVQSVRVNSWCASVVIEYNARIPNALQHILSALNGVNAPNCCTAAGTGALKAILRNFQTGLRFVRRPHTLFWSSTAIVVSMVIPGAAGIMLPALALSALPSFIRAWRVLRKERRLNVDFLDSVAIAVSIGRGQFFTAAFMAWMISLGDWIRDKTAARSKKALNEMLKFQATTAWVVRNKHIVRVSSDAVKSGETVVVYPGEIIPVDGVVRSGRAAVDQKTVTGESLPVEKAAGHEVFASTVLHEGKLHISASRVGFDTTAAQIVKLIESAPVAETRLQNYAEKFGDRLVAPMLLFSSSLYAITGNLDRLLSMAIIDFGTGIRVAAPTAVLAAMTHAARHGILIKGGRHMEKLASVDTIVFDKTGTLTHGTPQIQEVISCDDRHFPAREILALAAAAEARLKHPVSRLWQRRKWKD